MYYPPRRLAAAAVCAILAGCALHFLYSLCPNALTALFSPICESLWEHGKLIFWPYLAAALWLNRGRPGGVRPWLLVLLLTTAAMLALGALCHLLLQVDAFWVDLALYIGLMVLAFWLPTRFSGPFPAPLWLLPIVGTVILGLLYALFTLWPPQHILFADLSSVQTWYQIPC